MSWQEANSEWFWTTFLRQIRILDPNVAPLKVSQWPEWHYFSWDGSAHSSGQWGLAVKTDGEQKASSLEVAFEHFLLFLNVQFVSICGDAKILQNIQKGRKHNQYVCPLERLNPHGNLQVSKSLIKHLLTCYSQKVDIISFYEKTQVNRSCSKTLSQQAEALFSEALPFCTLACSLALLKVAVTKSNSSIIPKNLSPMLPLC